MTFPATRDRLQTYAGRRVLLTGHTGFKGAWLAHWLKSLGAHVSGISLPGDDLAPLGKYAAAIVDHDLRLDLSRSDDLPAILREIRPDVGFHLAAQALVPIAARDPGLTHRHNVEGTEHLLEAIAAECPAAKTLVVTTDKVYRASADIGHRHTEDDPLGGSDPYSRSKVSVEALVRAARDGAYGHPLTIATARAGNAIGAGDRGAGRLFPDIWRCLENGEVLAVRQPDAVRPWQFVLDPLYGYLLQAAQLDTPGTPHALNFGPAPENEQPVRQLLEIAARDADLGWEARAESFAETPILRIDSSRAQSTLGWRALASLEDALAWSLADERGLQSQPVQTVLKNRIQSYLAQRDCSGRDSDFEG